MARVDPADLSAVEKQLEAQLDIGQQCTQGTEASCGATTKAEARDFCNDSQ